MTDFDRREGRMIAEMRRRAADYAHQPPPPEPAMWSVIVIGLSAGVAMLAAGIAFAKFFL
jgi:hypothetical protein